MRTLTLFLFGAICAFSQPVGFGVKGGIPLTNLVSAVHSGTFDYNSSTNRYIVGPTVELRLPAGFGVEFDALYRRLHYDGSGFVNNTFTTSQTTGNNWEFPLLLKYRIPTEVVRPYVDAGIAWNTLTGIRQSASNAASSVSSAFTQNPPELHRNVSEGVVVGVGLDVHVLLHISPEVRYTRWGSALLQDANGILNTKRDQAEFLVGITF
ncbi:MAG TPA: outer membrane beta-barrel protein [Bryobacteraceae bacterium]|nr:outer membrane beta-barrel protein [Bryobacteraceae bacterium]